MNSITSELHKYQKYCKILWHGHMARITTTLMSFFSWIISSKILVSENCAMNKLILSCLCHSDIIKYHSIFIIGNKKGVPSAIGFPHCAGSGEGLSLSPKPYPHKCAEAGARTRDLPVTDGRLYRCTRPALLFS